MELDATATTDQIACYQLVLGCMPEWSEWAPALGLRGDGTNPEQILSCLAAMRGELYIRIGDLGSRDVRPIPSLTPEVESINLQVAYELLLSHLPLGDWIPIALQERQDGSKPDGVHRALDAWRDELRTRLMESTKQVTIGS